MSWRIFDPNKIQRLIRTALRWGLVLMFLLLGSAPLVQSRANVNATHTVCLSKCDFTLIQEAVDAGNPGDSIRVEASLPHTENNIFIDKNIHIAGLGMTATIVQGAISIGDTENPVFHISSGAVVTIKDLSVRHGGKMEYSNPGAIINDGGVVTLERVRVLNNVGVNFAGIKNQGVMTINDSIIENNTSSLGGTGIVNLNILVIYNSKITNNNGKDAEAGGIYNTGNLTIKDSTISDNAGYHGGIATFGGSVEITGTTIHSNSARYDGGGIYIDWPEVSMVNVTISGNEAFGGGGGLYISDKGEVRFANVTVSDNTADSDDDGGGNGGGVYVDPAGALHMKNSIVAGNHDLSDFFLSRAHDCHGLIDSDGYNLIGNLGVAVDGTHCQVGGSSTGDRIGVDAELGPLQDNGGPTLTHALLPGSPAIDAGNPAGCTDYDSNPTLLDQRGMIRHDRCDIGSYEADAFLYPVYLPIISR